MSTDDEGSRKRDERERETIVAMALIAPSAELVGQVMALGADADAVVDTAAAQTTGPEPDRLAREAP